MSEKPVLLLITRNLSSGEITEFYRHFTHVLIINETTSARKLIEFKNDTIVVCDVRTMTGKDYFSENSKYLDENKDNIVVVRASGDRFGDSSALSGVKYNTKRIRTGCPDKTTFMHHLLQLVDVPAIQGTKKRLLKKLLTCCFGSQVKQ